jgi:hypothetical protein
MMMTSEEVLFAQSYRDKVTQYKQNFEESKDTYYNISMHSTAIFG